MQVSDHILEALDTVMAWSDLPDESYPEAISSTACHLAGLEPQAYWDSDADNTLH